jgi:hypothetical protein
VTAGSSDYSSFYDALGSAATAQSNAESFATSAVATETSRAETAEALLVQNTTTVNGHALSSNVTISASDLTTGSLPNAQLPNSSVSGISGFFGGIGPNPQNAATSGSAWSASAGYFSLFYLPFAVTIGHATCYVVAVSASGSKQISFGLYPASAGSTALVIASCNVSSGQATGARALTISTGSGATIPAGWYYFVSTMNATDVSVAYWSEPYGLLYTLLNTNGVRQGTTAVTTPGTCNGTLGTLTSGSGTVGVMCLFEP